VDYLGDRVFVKSVQQNGGAWEAGLSAGDEIISINNLRVLKTDYSIFLEQIKENKHYEFLISRNAMLQVLTVSPKHSLPEVSSLKKLNFFREDLF